MKKLSILSLAGMLAAGGWWFFTPSRELVHVFETEILDPLSQKEMYQIPMQGKDYYFSKVKSGQTFSVLLNGLGLSMEKVNEVIAEAKGVFDASRMRAGKKLCIISDCETGTTTHLVYEENATDFICFELGEKIKVSKGEKPVKIENRIASGEINGSLWNAFEKQNLPLDLVMRISEIYAWEIDFFRLQKGDRFMVHFDEEFVDDKSIGVGSIHSIRFVHQGEEYSGYYFEQEEGRGDYYDQDGNSLRKAFLKAPLKFSRISSGYTMKRFHPILKKYTAHPGIDYAAPKGTPILAVGDGTIIEAQFKGGNGNYVKIRHNQTYQTQYLHMSKFGPGIKSGVHVKQGQVIGYVGSTGLSTGPHLCYRFWKNGVQVNPLNEKFPTAEPIKKEKRSAFDGLKNAESKILDKLSTDTGAEAGEDQES